jgi:hypothetical protein
VRVSKEKCKVIQEGCQRSGNVSGKYCLS